MTSNTDILIAIVAFKNVSDVVACLSAIVHLDYARRQTVICENGGKSAFEALVAALSHQDVATGTFSDPSAEIWKGTLTDGSPLTMIWRDNPGYAGALNAIAALTESPRSDILILNPDTIPSPNSLTEMVRLREAGHSIVGATLVAQGSGKVQLTGGRWRKWMARGLNVGMGGSAADSVVATPGELRIDYVSGAAMLVSRELWDELNGMDERYFLYCEDVDLCLRRGSRTIGCATTALVTHAHGSTIGSNRLRRRRSRLSVYLDERSRLMLTRKLYPRSYPVIAVFCLALTLQYLRDGAFVNFVVALKGWWAGIRSETGKPSWAN